MKKKRTAQSAFFNPRASIRLLVGAAVAGWIISGTLLAFFRPEAPANSSQRTLTFAERVAYQRAIEEVYWRHRIWPKERPDPKPSLDEVMSQAQLEEKVQNYLRNSQALEDYWQRPITAEQLQAEMERMAQHSKQPEVLRELFEALGNDPLLIAECVARPALAERLLTNWYAYDQRFQGELKQQAEADLFAHPTVAQMKQLSGNYSEIEVVNPDSAYTEYSRRPEHAVKLKRHDWDATVQKLAAAFNRPGSGRMSMQRSSHGAMSAWSPAYQGQGASTQRDGFNISGLNKNSVASAYASLPIGRPSPLQEDKTHYYATAVIDKTPGRLKLATVSWRKEPLESWLATRENQTPQGVGVQPGGYTLPKISVGGGCIDDTWAPSALNLPDPRDSHTAVWTGSEMIVWGGGFGYPPTSFDTGGRYNPSTETWTRTSTVNAPSARGAHTAVWTGSEMIVWGGGDNSGAALNTGGRYNPSTDSWTATSTTDAPAGRSGHSAVWTGTQMIVWGGRDTIGNLNTGGRYNPSTNSWTAMSMTNAPTPRSWHSTVWTGSEMIVWGGYVYNNINQYLNTGGRYNPSTNSWTATSITNAPTARESHTAVWTGSQMIVWGGDSYQAYQLNTGARYNPNTDGWTTTSTTNAPVGRDGHTAIWTGNQMIVWGGYGNLIGRTNTGGRYDPGTDSWSATSTTNAADLRAGHTAVWTGSEMIVWGGGGNSSQGVLDTGGRYNPATNTWITNDPPVPRIYHTAVSTGSEMIVWGGLIANMALSTGARYNPSTDDWTATSTTNAPSPRYVHTAVWTGTEMIVWGGVGQYVLPDIGGRYNPITNSWAAASITNSPSARSGHTAVWAGNEMIVWGGLDGSGNLVSTGGRYNPGTDSWSATSTVNAPVGRELHTAVWTGNEMVVWGGCGAYMLDYGCVSFLNDGGRYNLSTDTWTATTTTNAPSGRYEHTAIWSGSEMIVWGGSNSVNGSNTGGKYDPNTDSWMATSTANAPSSRYLHTVVWTGNEMIVWGGGTDAPTYLLNTGGRYTPDTDSWTATSTTGNAPEGRDWHTAVWIGNEMLVWGGMSLYGLWSDSGGIYCAQGGPSPTPTPTPCTARCSPTPRPCPTSAPRPTPPPRLAAPPTPTGSPRPTPAPRP